MVNFLNSVLLFIVRIVLFPVFVLAMNSITMEQVIKVNKQQYK